MSIYIMIPVSFEDPLEFVCLVLEVIEGLSFLYQGYFALHIHMLSIFYHS